MERNVIKLGKRNAISRLFRSQEDKDKIASWRLDLNRVLHVFNVRSEASPPSFLTARPQTELSINTNAKVSDIHNDVANTQNIVSDIHRTMMERQEGVNNGNVSVSNRNILSIIKRILSVPKMRSRFAI